MFALIRRLGCVALGAAIAPAASVPEPLWAYGFSTPPAPGDKAIPQALPTRALRPREDPAEQTKLRRVEDSSATYSLVDIRDLGNVIDWFPGDHPPMSAIMKHGPASLGPAARGCASCHLPNGKGRPENAPVSGLPVSYFIRQMQDFRDGLRATVDPRKPNTPTGLADVPGIAGRSPSYLVRQIYDMQRGTRKGASAPLMQPTVANLTGDDMVAIAAYVTSLVPPPNPPTDPARPSAAKKTAAQ